MKKILTLLFAFVLCIGANAAQLNLADVINKALTEQKPANGFYAVLLDSNNEYVLNSQINLGQNKVAIWGSAIVKVEGDGQIATQTYFAVNGVSFDLADAKKAPLALEAVTKETLPEAFTMSQYEGASRDVPHYDYKYSLYNCNFANVKNGIFYDNGKNWAIEAFEISNCIIQIDDDAKRTFEEIGAIKTLIMKNNTIYSVKGTKQQIIRFNNPNNSRPTYNWGTEARGHFILKDNTFYNITKDFGNNVPSFKLDGVVPTITVTAKGNIFYNTFRFINKFVQTNSVKDFTASDNIEFSNNPSVNIENYGTQVDPGFTAPTAALDLNNTAALKACFAADGIGAPMWYAKTYKTSIDKAAGKNFELILGPDIVDLQGGIKEGAVKPVMADGYAWIEYVNPTSVCDDGRAEVQKAERWTDIDPAAGTGEHGEFIQVKGENGSVSSPVISKQNGKVINLYVKNTAKVVVYATGSGGSASDLNAIVLTATTATGDTIVAQTEPGTIAGKGSKSEACAIELDPAKAWKVEINSLIEKDMMVTGLNLYGEDLSVASTYYTMGKTYESEKGKANYEVIYTPDLLTMKNLDTNTKKAAIDVLWADYTNFSSVLMDGSHEVSVGNCYTSYDVYTQEPVEADKMIMEGTGADGVWYGYPKVEAAKEFTFRVQDVMTVGLLLTGSGSNNNVAVVTDGWTEYESDPMPGKSQAKVIGEGSKATNSSILTLFVNPYEKNTITVRAKEGATAIAAIYLTNDFWFEYSPANELGETNGIENVETVKPVSRVAYNIAGQRVANNAKGLIIVNGQKFINK